MHDGLDIHAHEVCLVQLNWHKKRFRVKKTASCPLPIGAIVDGKIKNASGVTFAIEQVAAANKIKKSSVVIALPSQIVMSKKILLPSVLQEDECEIEISTQLAHYLPGISDALCFDFIRLSQQDAHSQSLRLVPLQ